MKRLPALVTVVLILIMSWLVLPASDMTPRIHVHHGQASNNRSRSGQHLFAHTLDVGSSVATASVMLTPGPNDEGEHYSYQQNERRRALYSFYAVESHTEAIIYGLGRGPPPSEDEHSKSKRGIKVLVKCQKQRHPSSKHHQSA